MVYGRNLNGIIRMISHRIAERIHTLISSNKVIHTGIFSFFAVYLILGLLIYKDYGISWDEHINRINGGVAAIEIVRKLNLLDKFDFSHYSIPKFSEYKDRDYGVFFEMILVGFEKIMKLEKKKDIYYMRHLMTFLLFYVSVIFFFRILNRQYGNKVIALIGCCLLVISPRIFAHSFYNSKDIAFLSLSIIALYYAFEFINQRNIRSLIMFCLTSGILIDVRIAGIYLPVLSITIVIIVELVNKRTGKAISYFLIFAGLTSATIILFWPYLWESPIINFIKAFSRMSKFPWNFEIYFAGSIITAHQVPAWYIPVWIFITTPVLYTIGFISGLYQIGIYSMQAGKNIFRSNELLHKYFFAAVFFIPLASVIVLGSPLYDGWRQMFFIYPAFILVSVQGLLFIYNFVKKWDNPFATCSLLLIFLTSCILSIVSMVRNHPFQMVYFNDLMKGHAVKNFEMEYYGLSYIYGFKKVLEIEKSKRNIYLFHGLYSPLSRSFDLMEPEERERFEFAEFEKAQYFITNYRVTLYNEQKLLSKYNLKKTDEVYSINAYGKKILSVFRLNQF